VSLQEKHKIVKLKIETETEYEALRELADYMEHYDVTLEHLYIQKRVPTCVVDVAVVKRYKSVKER
jgi:hypothetical protein